MTMQSGETRIRIVREYLGSIEDPQVRCVCFLLSRKTDDREICRQLKIRMKQLRDIKNRIADELLEAGIVLRGTNNHNEQKESQK